MDQSQTVDRSIDASDAYSKSWEEFEEAAFDFVITLCDNARESCPVWSGQPINGTLEFPRSSRGGSATVVREGTSKKSNVNWRHRSGVEEFP
jgi:protein-tyrosine-phosphatase